MKKYLSLIIFFLICLAIQSQTLPNESVHVHVSKSLLITGESIRFRTWVQSETGPAFSKIAYAELIDRNSNAVAQVIFPLENGSGENYLLIPNTLESDHYIFRVYTRTSPYLGQEGIYNQFVTIINPKLPPGQAADQVTKNTYSSIEHSFKTIDLIETGISTSFDLPLDNFPKSEKNTFSIAFKNPFLPKNQKGFFRKEIYQHISQVNNLIPEPYGHIIHAKTLDYPIDTTETFFLSSHGNQSVLNSSKPDMERNLYFELGPLKDYNFLIAQSEKQEKQLNFSPQSPFAAFEFKNDFHFPTLILEEKDKELLQKLIVAGKSESYFTEEEIQEFLPIATGFVADRTYLLDDYTRFENLEVTLKEYVPEVLVRRQSRKMVLKVLDKPTAGVFQENPLVLIDAMPIFDVDKFGKMDPKGLKKLEVLSREFFLNKDRFAGVVSFSSFENDFGGFELPENALYLNYWPVQAPKKYISPHLIKIPKPDHFPDFRTKLYWSSDFDIHTQKTFYASRVHGEFELVYSYFDENGTWQQIRGTLNVSE
ncbi:hypothetical protein [Indibacter alkaliphilus]|nr:hypothetical protein [Indibacter alkaliphilus]